MPGRLRKNRALAAKNVNSVQNYNKNLTDANIRHYFIHSCLEMSRDVWCWVADDASAPRLSWIDLYKDTTKQTATNRTKRVISTYFIACANL
jgi:hypothetical protein